MIPGHLNKDKSKDEETLTVVCLLMLISVNSKLKKSQEVTLKISLQAFDVLTFQKIMRMWAIPFLSLSNILF